MYIVTLTLAKAFLLKSNYKLYFIICQVNLTKKDISTFNVYLFLKPIDRFSMSSIVNFNQRIDLPFCISSPISNVTPMSTYNFVNGVNATFSEKLQSFSNHIFFWY